MMKTLKKENRAFSLLELITAIFIFSFGIISVLGIFHKCLVYTRQMSNYHLASGLVQSEIEFLRSLEFDQLKDCKDAPFLRQALDLQRLKNGSGKLTIEDYMNPQIKKVTISIVWTEDKNNRSISITTLIANHPLNEVSMRNRK